MKMGLATSASSAESFQEGRVHVQASQNLNRARSVAVSADPDQRLQATQSVQDATRAALSSQLGRNQASVEQAKESFARIDAHVSEAVRDTNRLMGNILMSQGAGSENMIDLGRFLDVYA